MNWLPDLSLFVLVMALGQFSPGPDMLLLTRTALREGLRPALQMVAGICTGLAIHGCLAIGGMAWLLTGHPAVETAVKALAALYLLWLAFGLLKTAYAMWRTEQILGVETKPGVVLSPYMRGFWCNILNPKVLVFFAGVVTPFLKPGDPSWWPFALWGVIVGEGLLLWALWAWFLQIPGVRARYQKSQAWLDAAFGIALLVIAFLLARSIFSG